MSEEQLQQHTLRWLMTDWIYGKREGAGTRIFLLLLLAPWDWLLLYDRDLVRPEPSQVPVLLRKSAGWANLVINRMRT
jgi:hypothetical protein